MNPPWLRPTVRLTPWAPVAVAALAGALVGQLLAATGAGPVGPLAVLLAGALAASVAVVLDDPCHALLAAVPTGVGTRLVRRLLVLAPAAVAGWSLVAASVGRAPGVAALIALASAALAVGLVTARTRPELSAAAGGAVAVSWSVSPLIAPPALEPLASLWLDRPAPVLAAAVLAALAAVRR